MTMLLGNLSAHLPPPSFVIGNSWQINQLTESQRQHLDSSPFVFACNLFPAHWRQVGFRPAVWAMGDTEPPESCDILERQLNAIRDDADLRQRLTRLFVCCESKAAFDIVCTSELPVTLYRRGKYDDRSLPLAKSLFDPLCHYGGTIIDLVNLALILNPGGEVRICGCQYRTEGRHFYEPDGDAYPIWPSEATWDTFAAFRAGGVNIVDCNLAHGDPLPPERTIPTGALI